MTDDPTLLINILAREKPTMQTASQIFDRITNTAREVRPAFAKDVQGAYNKGDSTGEGFEPDLGNVDAKGMCAPDLDLYVIGDRLLAVGDKGGAWAVDITAAMREALA